MTDHNESPAAAGDEARFQRVCELLASYPQLQESEKAEIAGFLRGGRIIDVGRLSGIDELAPKLAGFRADERRRLGLQARDYIIVAAALLVFAVLVLLMWDAGSGR